VAIAGIGIQYVVLRIGFRKILAKAVIHRPEPTAAVSDNGEPAIEHHALDQRLLILTFSVLALVFAGFFAGFNLSWTALAGGALVMVLARRDTHEVLKLVDWHLLVFFAALFIVVAGLDDAGLPDQIYGKLRGVFGTTAGTQGWNLAWFSVLGSNIFSNVPFVLVAGKWIHNFAQPDLMWKVMALATTFAGNLTILGSVANIIVVETARRHVEFSFWDYAKYGIPVTILTTVAGMVILMLTASF